MISFGMAPLISYCMLTTFFSLPTDKQRETLSHQSMHETQGRATKITARLPPYHVLAVLGVPGRRFSLSCPYDLVV